MSVRQPDFHRLAEVFVGMVLAGGIYGHIKFAFVMLVVAALTAFLALAQDREPTT